MARLPRKARHRPSTIDTLDPEIRKLIAELRIDRGWTIDDIRDRLIAMGQSVSRSALGRHIRSIADVGAEMRETQIYAEALARELGGDSSEDLIQLNSQILSTIMFKLAVSEKDGEGIMFSTKEAKEFSEALRNIALMRKTQQEVIARAEAEATKRATAAAAENATKAARSKGLSKETVDAIRHAVLGSDA